MAQLPCLFLSFWCFLFNLGPEVGGMDPIHRTFLWITRASFINMYFFYPRYMGKFFMQASVIPS